VPFTHSLPHLLPSPQALSWRINPNQDGRYTRSEPLGPPLVSHTPLLTFEVSFLRQMGLPPVTTTGRSLSASISLLKIANWDGTSQGIAKTLTAAFEADDYLYLVKNLKELDIDPQSYIDSLDKVSSYPILRERTQFITIWR
jgi:hypothetical protein